MQRSFNLHFAGDTNIELVEACFSDTRLGIQRRSVRGKTAGAFKNVGSFQWTTAVKALAILALKTGSVQVARSAGIGHQLVGGKGSFAASLDYALSKQPEWLTEMFGVDSGGISVARRLILRTNPERKRPGPVVLCFSENAINTVQFRFTFNGSAVESLDAIQHLLSQLSENMKSLQSTEYTALGQHLAA
jgi:hypothetical protein